VGFTSRQVRSSFSSATCGSSPTPFGRASRPWPANSTLFRSLIYKFLPRTLADSTHFYSVSWSVFEMSGDLSPVTGNVELSTRVIQGSNVRRGRGACASVVTGTATLRKTPK